MKTAGFLLNRSLKTGEFALILLFSIVFVLLWTLMPMYAALLVVAAVGLFFMFRLDVGLYLLVVLGFLHGLEIDFGKYQWARDIPYLPGINAPAGDVLVVLLMMSFVGALLFRTHEFTSLKKLKELIPGFVLYGLFILVALVSALSAYEYEFGLSLKYLGRPIIFVFFAFVLFILFVLKSKKQISKVFFIWFWLGVLSALFGLSSLFILEHTGWWRVTPYNLFGLAPFGYNHNQLAEVLVTFVPIGIFLSLKNYGTKKQVLYNIGTALIILASLLTLSRAAWLVLLVQLFMYFIWLKRDLLKKYKKNIGLLAISLCIVVVGAYMIKFLSSSVVKSSTSARWAATQVTTYNTLRSPLIGYGPGMYMSVLTDSLWYTIDYGDPLESHGFIQKVALEEGIIGLILFGGFLLWVLYYLYKLQKDNDRYQFLFQTLFIMVLSAIVFQLFNTSYFNSVMWLPIGVALSATCLVRDND